MIKTNIKHRVDIDIDLAKRLLLEYGSLPKVARIMNLNLLTLRLRLRKNGIDVKKRKYTLNEEYFEKIDNPNKAYFLGLLYADGNVFMPEGRVSINIEQSDGYILQSLLNDVGSNMSIKLRTFNKPNHRPQNNISLSSKKLSEQLIKLGCVPRKSLILKFPTEEQVPSHLIRHFVRGYFDGDGSVYMVKGKYKRLVFNLVGTIDMMNGFKKLMEKELNLGYRKIYKNGNVYSLSYGGNLQCKRIYEWLYKDCEDLYLKRKKERFEDPNYQPAIYNITKKCLFDGCNNLRDCCGVCNRHYQFVRYYRKKLNITNGI